ncbi:MAG: hypothetical protein ACOY9Y_10415 [Bacillota bacterium]
MNKKVVLGLTIIFVLTLLFLPQVVGKDFLALRGSGITFSNEALSEAGKELGGLIKARFVTEKEQIESIAVLVNGFPIFEKHLLMACDFYQAKNIPIDKARIASEFIRAAALAGEAQRRGVGVTIEDAFEYSIKEVHDGLERQDPLLLSILNGSGLTPEEFAEKVQLHSNHIMLNINALNELLASDLNITKELEQLTQEEMAIRNSYLDMKHQEIIAQASLEIINEKYQEWFKCP